MPKCCAVIRCHSSSRKRDRKFHRFPMLQRSSERALAITQIRQELWVRALNRADFPPSRYKHATVCDRHFVSGRSAYYTDVENVDWVPSLHLGYEPFEIKTEATKQESPSLHLGHDTYPIKTEPNEVDDDSDDRFVLNELQQSDYLEDVSQEMDPLQQSDCLEEVTQGMDPDDISESPNGSQDLPLNFICLDTVGTQTDDAITGMSADILRSYQAKIAQLEATLSDKYVKV